MQPNQPRVSMLSFPDWLPTLKFVQPSLRNLFLVTTVVAPLPGRTQKFLANQEKVTSDRAILNIVKGWEIPLLNTPTQIKIPHGVQMNSLEERAADLEIENMLAKGAIRKVISKWDPFLSNFFVIPKGKGLFRPIINLKELNSYVPYCSLRQYQRIRSYVASQILEH